MFKAMGSSSTPMQFIRREPHNTGINPIPVATAQIARPPTPVIPRTTAIKIPSVTRLKER
ncbi:MAG: hypothetical protein BWY25_02968 [Chloroflexi bacterium ADurb.Bin222]|nr:MAG: hypothetical protein BWY25_02968 [Chloroflexi bacterium ADurb.Bin222]